MPASAPTVKIDQTIDKLRDLSPERLAEVSDFIDLLRSRPLRTRGSEKRKAGFPVISLGQWPDDLPVGREALYGDDGR